MPLTKIFNQLLRPKFSNLFSFPFLTGLKTILHSGTCPYRPFMAIAAVEFFVSLERPAYSQRMNPSKFDLGLNVMTQVKFRRICVESSQYNWANISEKICPTMLVFGKLASWMKFFQNILTNSIISQI